MIYIFELFENKIDYIGTIESISLIILNIILGVTAIKGFSYLLDLRDKTLGATFNYFALLKIRIETLKKFASQTDIFANMCDVDIRSKLGVDVVDEELLKELKAMMDELYNFLKSTPDQMPAYPGWTDDIDKLCSFILDAQYFDITNPNEKFKFKNDDFVDDSFDYSVSKSVTEYRKYVDNHIENMNNIIGGITNKQHKVEDKINLSFSKKAKKILDKVFKK